MNSSIDPPRGAYTFHTIPHTTGTARPHSANESVNNSTPNRILINIRYESAIHSLGEIRAVTELLDTLMDIPTLRHSETLPKTLASLKRMLEWIKLAVQVYEHTPLAATLDDFITAQVELCRRLLRQLLTDLPNYRYALSAAMVHLIRKYMWSTIGEMNAISAADSNLRECHDSFASCVLALGR